MSEPVLCKCCKKVITPPEIAAYGGSRCEDCWGQEMYDPRSSKRPWGAARCYTNATDTDIQGIKAVSNNVKFEGQNSDLVDRRRKGK